MPAPVILNRLMDRWYRNSTNGRFWECRLNDGYSGWGTLPTFAVAGIQEHQSFRQQRQPTFSLGRKCSKYCVAQACASPSGAGERLHSKLITQADMRASH